MKEGILPHTRKRMSMPYWGGTRFVSYMEALNFKKFARGVGGTPPNYPPYQKPEYQHPAPQNQGERAQRNPRLTSELDGEYLYRKAVRTPYALRLQPPPRSTRDVPVSGPGGLL